MAKISTSDHNVGTFWRRKIVRGDLTPQREGRGILGRGVKGTLRKEALLLDRDKKSPRAYGAELNSRKRSSKKPQMFCVRKEIAWSQSMRGGRGEPVPRGAACSIVGDMNVFDASRKSAPTNLRKGWETRSVRGLMSKRTEKKGTLMPTRGGPGQKETRTGGCRGGAEDGEVPKGE